MYWCSAWTRKLLHFVCGMCLLGSAWANDPAVLVLSSEISAPYQEAAEALVTELARSNSEARKDVLSLSLADFGTYRGAASRLYIALGAQACGQLARIGTVQPLLCTLLPRASFERVLKETGRKPGATLTAVYLNQPYGRQLDLVRLALPQARRIGVLWGADSWSGEPLLEAAAQTRGLRVVGDQIKGEEPVFSGLKRILDDADLLLAVPDPSIYNSSSIQNILLASFRAQVPMLAFSPAYARAGALLALYSTPAQIGQQAGQIARGVLSGQPLGVPAYPQNFEISVNENVARSLGLRLDATTLTERLRREPGS